MKWNLILKNGRYSLLQNESDTQFVVASKYDPKMPENNQWDNGSYFCYRSESEKAIALSQAVELFRFYTEEDFIPRSRLEELATNFKDGLWGSYLEDDDYTEFFLDDCDMTESELAFFGIFTIDRKDEEDDE